MHIQISITIISLAIIIAAIILSRIAYKRLIIDLTTAAIISGLGAGIGDGLFVYFTFGKKDFFGSFVTAILIAAIVGITVYVYFRSDREKKR